MYEEDLRTLDQQIERAREALQNARCEWERYQLERKIMVYQDMRLDLLLQLKFFEEHPPTPREDACEPETIL